MIFKQDLKKVRAWVLMSGLQALGSEGTGSAKGLRQEYSGIIVEQKRPLWLRGSKPRTVGGEEIREETQGR